MSLEVVGFLWNYWYPLHQVFNLEVHTITLPSFSILPTSSFFFVLSSFLFHLIRLYQMNRFTHVSGMVLITSRRKGL